MLYLPVANVVASVDSCTHQLARLLGIARQGQLKLAVLVSRSFVENMMEVVSLSHEHNVEIVTSVKGLLSILTNE